MHQVIQTIILLCLFGTAVSKSCLANPQARKCLEVFKELGEQAGHYDLTNKNSTVPTNALCGRFKRCAPTFSCDPEPKLVYAVNITILFCDSIDFFTNTFLPCQMKLDADTTECTRAWDPFPKEIKDKKVMKEVQEYACKNYFGKDNCMKDHIIQVCDVEMWNGFRKHHLALNTIIGACDFKEGEPA
ncbi:hypothetical protein L3Y34_019277 [Caenorhabditis briggsae]|uniref:T20D4.11-like domain-containing protein n=1 Tax=Caenorhabditis briggsae TaxID=6238 RepID=A0AAE9DNL5_CAEBR|nr:hypothetical protein L3Y34_019277 [Caenorhabditis briggsae]